MLYAPPLLAAFYLNTETLELLTEVGISTKFQQLALVKIAGHLSLLPLAI